MSSLCVEEGKMVTHAHTTPHLKSAKSYWRYLLMHDV